MLDISIRDELFLSLHTEEATDYFYEYGVMPFEGRLDIKVGMSLL